MSPLTVTATLRALLDAIAREQMVSDGGAYLKLTRIDHELVDARRVLAGADEETAAAPAQPETPAAGQR